MNVQIKEQADQVSALLAVCLIAALLKFERAFGIDLNWLKTNTTLNNQGIKQPGQLFAWPTFLPPAFSAHNAISSDAAVVHKKQIRL